MRGKNVGHKLWSIFGPMVIYMAISTVVQITVFFIYYAIQMPEFVNTVQTMDEFMQVYEKMLQEVLYHAAELTGLSALLTIPILAWMRRRDRKKGVWTEEAGSRNIAVSGYFWIPVLAIPISVVLNNLIVLSNVAAYSESYQNTTELLYMPSLPVQILCIVILAPIVEEYIFRGLIFVRIKQGIPAKFAIVFSALLFGFFHGNLVQFLYGFACGLLLAWLYEAYGTLKAPVIAHMVMNLASVLMTEFDVYVWMFSDMTRMAVLTILCAALASSAFLKVQGIRTRA